MTGPVTGRWRLAEVSLPFPELRLPAGEHGTGRLVRVTVDDPSHASFAGRHAFISSDIGLNAIGLPIMGTVVLEKGSAQVLVYTSSSAGFVLRLWAFFFIVTGVCWLVAQPSVWNAIMALVFSGVGLRLLFGMPKAGRRVAADAVDILGRMARGEGNTVFTV